MVSTNSTALTAAAIGIEDVQGLPFWDCYWWNWSPRVQEELRAHVARAAAGEASRYDAEIRIAQGELTTVEFVIAPMRDGQDRVAFLVATGVDISDRRRTEMTLNEREQFYRQLIESMPLLTWTCTPDGTCDFISSRWHKYAGQVVDPGCLFTNMEQVHPDDRDGLRGCWEQGLESGPRVPG